MFLYLISAFILAKIKGYKIKPAFKAFPLYPYAAAELLYLFLQFSIFTGNYSFVKYTAVINSIYMYTLLIPIFVYKLYRPGLVGSALIVAGTFLNKFVMSQNGGKMPVYASLSKLTGYYNEMAIQTVDNIHIAGTDSARYKFLADFIDTGCSILSIGDILIHSFVFIVMYYSIKAINKNLKTNTRSGKDILYGLD